MLTWKKSKIPTGKLEVNKRTLQMNPPHATLVCYTAVFSVVTSWSSEYKSMRGW